MKQLLPLYRKGFWCSHSLIGYNYCNESWQLTVLPLPLLICFFLPLADIDPLDNV